MKMKTLWFCLLSIFISSSAFSSTVFSHRYGDRVFVSNILKEIFGEQSVKYIDEEIRKRPQVFGGPCDPYSQALVAKGDSYEIKGDSERCISSFFAEYTIPTFTGPTPIRSGILISLCQRLSQCEPCLEYALVQAGLSHESVVSEKGFFQVYQLFYPARAHKDARRLFLPAQNHLKNENRPWPFIMNLVCQTEEWQIL